MIVYLKKKKKNLVVDPLTMPSYRTKIQSHLCTMLRLGDKVLKKEKKESFFFVLKPGARIQFWYFDLDVLHIIIIYIYIY